MLVTGVNAAERLGRHVTVFPGPRLTRLLETNNLLRGEAVAWDIVPDRFGVRAGRPTLPATVPCAGSPRRRLGATWSAWPRGTTCILWETYPRDLAGHRRAGVEPAEAMGRVDGLVGGVLAHRSLELTVLVTSDHGNLEAAGRCRHTRHPVPLLAVGPRASDFAGTESLTGVTLRLLWVLGASPGPDVCGR